MNKLWLRLAISFLLVTWLVIAIIALMMQATVGSGFNQYVNQSDLARIGENFVQEVEQYYASHQTWKGVEGILPRRGQGQGNGNGQGQPNDRGAQVFIASPDGIIVAATNDSWIGQSTDTIEQSRSVQLHENGTVIGILGEQTPGAMALSQAETRFLEDTTNSLLVTAVVAGLVAFLLGIGVAWMLTRPLNAFTEQVGNLTASDIGQQITVKGTDEMVQLSHAFNTLSERLAEGEQARQRMAADVAHELRTPVTVMRGHMEAMMDGVYPVDSEHLAVAYNQILHLARLVEDSRLLTMAEAGRLPLNMTQIHMHTLIEQAVDRFQPLVDDANISLTATIDKNTPPVRIDPDRIQQVIDNLLTNALRHTPSGGSITITLRQDKTRVYTAITNTGNTIPDEQAKHLFDRFWRATEARERDSSGSGLGLAITKQLLRLHDGNIRVIPEMGKATFEFNLPCVGD